jgi:hypothetical protein
MSNQGDSGTIQSTSGASPLASHGLYADICSAAFMIPTSGRYLCCNASRTGAPISIILEFMQAASSNASGIKGERLGVEDLSD